MNNELKLMTDIANSKLLTDVEIMKSNLPSQIEFYKVFAKIHRAKFEALIKAGYSEAQAFGLIGKF